MLNSEEARKVGDQRGTLQIVKLKRMRTRLGEFSHVKFVYSHEIIIIDV